MANHKRPREGATFAVEQPPRPAKKFGFGRIGARPLARICHNVGTALHAGVDIRRVFQTESERGSARQRAHMTDIRDRVASGDALASAMAASNGYFPPLVVEMVDVGERTGRLERVFFRLGEHYDQLVKLRRNFVAGIAWPMFELTLAIFVIGAYIYISGAVWNGQGAPPMTFFGLYGAGGLKIYIGILLAIILPIVGLILGVKYGFINLDPLLKPLMLVPGARKGLETIAMSRLTWSMAMATDSDLDPRKAIEMAVKTTQNAYYTQHIGFMKDVISGGGEMIDAFQKTAAFPDDFLDALQTGEIAGRISETMEVIAKEYEQREKQFYRTLAVVMGAVVFLTVVGLMIAMIFSLAMQYIGMINDFAQP